MSAYDEYMSQLSDIANDSNTGNFLGMIGADSGRAQKIEYLSAMAQNAYNAEQAQIARDFNASEAQKQRDFEERMSSSAYERAVSDMRNAGLNPYLVYSNGGSSTPSGGTASSSAASAAGVTGVRGNASLTNLITSVAGAVLGGVRLGLSDKASSAKLASSDRYQRRAIGFK